jgi:hypothetical protein
VRKALLRELRFVARHAGIRATNAPRHKGATAVLVRSPRYAS